MKRLFIIFLVLFVPVAGVKTSQLALGIRSEKLIVRHYWRDAEARKHELLIFNMSSDTIVVRATLDKHEPQTLRTIDSKVYFDDVVLCPKEKRVFDYPCTDTEERLLAFSVNGEYVGLLGIYSSEPPFDIPKNRIISRGGRNLWLILEDIIVPFRKNIKFTMVMECRNNESDPYYLLLTQFRAKVEPKDGLVLRRNNDILYETRIDFPEYEEGSQCYRRIDVTLKDLQKSNKPMKPEYAYQVARGPKSYHFGIVPIIIWSME